jgi:hypothetical protein
VGTIRELYDVERRTIQRVFGGATPARLELGDEVAVDAQAVERSSRRGHRFARLRLRCVDVFEAALSVVIIYKNC